MYCTCYSTRYRVTHAGDAKLLQQILTFLHRRMRMMRKTTVMKTKTRTAAKTATWEKRAGEKFEMGDYQHSTTAASDCNVQPYSGQYYFVLCYSTTEVHTGGLYSQVAGSPSRRVCGLTADSRQRRETLQSQHTVYLYR